MMQKPLNNHSKKLAVGDEVYWVRFSRYGNSYLKTKVQKLYKNGNVVVYEDQFRCREAYGGWSYTQTGGRNRWSTSNELWPINAVVEARIAEEKNARQHAERARALRDRFITTHFRELTAEQLDVLEQALDSVTEKEKT